MGKEEVSDAISSTMSRLYDPMMRGYATEVRAMIEPHFSEETSQPGSWMSKIPSSGHCVVASLVVHVFLGARCDFVSKEINGQSHWWVRCREEYGGADIDITADQFGESPVLTCVTTGGLRPGAKIRRMEEIDLETKNRFLMFFSKMNGLNYYKDIGYILSQ